MITQLLFTSMLHKGEKMMSELYDFQNAMNNPFFIFFSCGGIVNKFMVQGSYASGWYSHDCSTLMLPEDLIINQKFFANSLIGFWI